MKYMILITASQQDYDAMAGKPEQQRARLDAGRLRGDGRVHGVFNKDLAESGELVDTRGLTAPAHARRIRLQEGAPVVTDGPYAEAKEVLAGYWIVDCDSFDRATEIASRLTDAPGRSTSAPARTWTCGRWPSHGTSCRADPCRRPCPRTCCASWRRRSSARWCGASGTSTPPRTRSRRRCWPRPAVAGRGDPGQPARLADHRRLPAADRPAARPSRPGGAARKPPPAGPRPAMAYPTPTAWSARPTTR